MCYFQLIFRPSLVIIVQSLLTDIFPLIEKIRVSVNWTSDCIIINLFYLIQTLTSWIKLIPSFLYCYLNAYNSRWTKLWRILSWIFRANL